MWSRGLPNGGSSYLLKLVGAMVARVAIGRYDIYVTSQMFGCLMTGDTSRFFSHTLLSLACLFGNAFSEEFLLYVIVSLLSLSVCPQLN